MKKLPLIRGYPPEGVIAWRNGNAVSIETFLSDVAALAERLPPKGYMINLCEDRYHFLIGLAAALLRGQINLLPSNKANRALQQIARDYPATYCLADSESIADNMETLEYAADKGSQRSAPAIPAFKAEQIAVIAFTSGSTGQPNPSPKTWGSLVAGTAMAGRRFMLSAERPGVIVGTVPPQHMYGLETTVLLPIQFGYAVEAGRPLFPEDIRATLNHVVVPQILITSPAHLRACVGARIRLPTLDFIISATAPLPVSLAKQAEEMFHAPVYEIYGFTEAGSVASRRTTESELWHTYDGISLERTTDGVHVCVPGLTEAAAMTDIIDLHDSHTFSLRGRSADLINIAGKRASLGDLNYKLNEVDGVLDGVFFMPDEVEDGVTRVMAFVVAPLCSAQHILSELRWRIDPAFLPRPLHVVDSLPRTETGKLPRECLEQLARSCAHKSALRVEKDRVRRA